MTDAAVHDQTLRTVLAGHARSRPEDLAVVCGDVRLTWRALDRRVGALARSLATAGVGVGDRVLWCGQNCHRLLELIAACAELGAVACPVNWRQSAAELAFVLDDAAPTVVCWQRQEIGPVVTAARAQVSGSARWVCHDAEPDSDGGGDQSYESFLAGAAAAGPDAASPAPGGPAVSASAGPAGAPVLMLYTGAFDGRPNGALLSHRALLSQALVNAMLRGYRSEDVFLNSGPMFHLGTLMCTFAAYLLGATNVVARRVDATVLLELISAERCTDAFVMPPTMAEMVEANSGGRYDLTSLRCGPSTPAWDAMVSADTSAWALRPGGTGQTEVSGLVTFAALGGEGAHGRPSPFAQVRVVDASGADVEAPEVGELVVQGPVVMNGYHDRAELNAFRYRDGWYHTGDLGRRHRDGSITFIGPMTRMIKSAAENIYPAEVEACLRAHPAVRDAAVIGVPDERWAQSVKAVVVRDAGSDLAAEELIDHCRRGIASYKKPRFVAFVDELPRRGWMIDYEALDAAHGGGGYPGGTNRSV